MNISDKQRTNAWAFGGSSDIALSNSDHQNIITSLTTPNFTPAGLMKMKNLTEIYWGSIGAISVQAMPIAYIGTQLISGQVRRSHSGYKYFVPIFMLLYPFTMWRMGRVPIQRRGFTDILCDEGHDGSYIRSTLRRTNPGLWGFVSKQMYDLGYEFEEINELRTNTEFTRTFVNY